MGGLDPTDILTDEEINKLLTATFKKFDTDNSKRLEKPEFMEAWQFLGLKGSEREILNAFDDVDTDSSGFVDLQEFVKAIKSNRSTELSLSVLLTQMDGHLEGMDGFFANYNYKLEEQKKLAAERMASQEEKFRVFQQTARRRRIMKKQMEEKLAGILR